MSLMLRGMGARPEYSKFVKLIVDYDTDETESPGYQLVAEL